MKKFLINCFCFFVIFTLGNLSVYYLIKEKYFANYGKTDLSKKMFLLSDSHGAVLEDFTKECNIDNFSEYSDSYLDILRKTRHLIKASDPKILIVTVDDHTLSPYRESKSNFDRSVIFAERTDYDNIFGYVKDKYLKRYLVIFNPKCRDLVFLYLKAKFFNSKAERGKSWETSSPAQRQEKALIRYKTQFPDDLKSVGLRSNLLEIIELCRENHISLMGMKFPITTEYREIINGQSYGADSLLRANGIRILDFTTFLDGQNEYFANQDHLNSSGAQKLATALCDSLHIFPKTTRK